MAIEGNKSGSFNGQYPQYATPYIFWSYEQSIPYNNTVLTVELKVKREKTGSTTYKQSTPWSIDIGGTKTSGTTSFRISNVSAGEYITIGTASKTFTHKDDGSFDPISISATIDLSGTSLGTGSVSESVTPNTIPRASSIKSIDGNMVGSNVTVNIDRKADGFTHNVFFTRFDGVVVQVGFSVEETCVFLPALSDADQIPNAPSGTTTITVDTYSGGAKVGTVSQPLILYVPDTVKPVINSVTISEGGTAVPSNWGLYVKGKSALKVDINASGIYGSSIIAYKITGIDGITYNDGNFTSAVLQEAKTYTIKVVVTDSRTRTMETEVQVVCVDYSNPLISVASVTRCNTDGSTNAKGTSVKYTFKASVSPVNNKNIYAYKLGYKKIKDDNFTYVDIANDSYTLDKSNEVISDVTFDSSFSYVFDFLVLDYFTSTSDTSNKINSGYKLINFNKSGKGIAFGKFSEKDALEIAMPTEASEPITAPIFNGKLNGTFIGGTNYIRNSQSPVTMVRPSSSYHRYWWDLEHPMSLKRATVDHVYTLSFKFIPEEQGYKPMESLVVGGADVGDSWSIRLRPDNFEVEEFEDYQIWSCTFKVPGVQGHYLQDHIGFILESSVPNTGGTVYELKLEDGANKTSWTPNINDHIYMYESDEIPFEYNTDRYNGSVRYIVKNGVCYLHVFFKTLNPSEGWKPIFPRGGIVPIPISDKITDFAASTQVNKAPVRFVVQGDGNISCHGGEASDTDYVGNLVYPCVG